MASNAKIWENSKGAFRFLNQALEPDRSLYLNKLYLATTASSTDILIFNWWAILHHMKPIQDKVLLPERFCQRYSGFWIQEYL